jgi:hypothetical protein
MEEPKTAHVSLHFELDDGGMLSVRSMSLPDLHLSSSDYAARFSGNSDRQSAGCCWRG